MVMPASRGSSGTSWTAGWWVDPSTCPPVLANLQASWTIARLRTAFKRVLAHVLVVRASGADDEM